MLQSTTNHLGNPVTSCSIQYCAARADGQRPQPGDRRSLPLLLLLGYVVGLLQADWAARQAVLAGYSKDPSAHIFIKESLIWRVMSQVNGATDGSSCV